VWHWTQKASNVYRSKPRHDEASDLHVPLLDIHPEGKLQREIKDILDELDIMISITRRQRELIRRFCKHVENILDPEGRWRHGSEDQSLTTPMDECDDNEGKGEAAPSPKGKSRSPDARAQGGTESDEDAEAQKANKAKEKTRREEERLDRITRKKHLEWFRMQSQDLLFDVSDRIDELEGLRESARSTAQSVSGIRSTQDRGIVPNWQLLMRKIGERPPIAETTAGQRRASVGVREPGRGGGPPGSVNHDVYHHHNRLCKSQALSGSANRII